MSCLDRPHKLCSDALIINQGAKQMTNRAARQEQIEAQRLEEEFIVKLWTTMEDRFVEAVASWLSPVYRPG